MDETTSLLFAISFWVNVVFELGVIIAAFVRLRTTPAGLLIGLGFLTMLGLSAATRLMWTFGAPSPEDMDPAMGFQQLELVSSGTWLCSSIVIVVIAVGTFLIPSSLGKLEEARAGRSPSSG